MPSLHPRALPFALSFLLAAAAALIAAAIVGWRPLPPSPEPGLPAAGRDAAPTAIAAAANPAGEPTAASREAVPPPIVAEPGFPARVDELVRLGQRTAELAQQDDTAGATANDQVARDRFADLMARFPDAGERALAMLADLDDEAVPLANGRRVVLQLVLAAECERRDHGAQATGDRASVDGLVHSLLVAMPGNATTADVGWRVLSQQRFLRAVHEGGVLALVALAGEQRFRRDIATDLLLTLWDNVQRFGERSSDELSRLSLLLLDDADPSRRTAACRHLLKDPRYRYLVLSWLRERGDQTVANELAGVAAHELPPAEALSLLRELSPALPRAPGAYLVLGFRAPDLVADDYRQLLAANTHADVRCDLVTGLGMAQTPLGREIAELALHHDPSLDVRMQAVFALTSRGDAELGERALQRILDEAGVAGDPQRMAAVVLALQNLAATGDSNAIDRVGRRLRAMRLPEPSRRQLEEILQRCLPGGG
jgi:hypothetical protein